MGKRQDGVKVPPSAMMEMMNEQMMPYSRKSTKRRHPSIVDTLDQRPFWLPDPTMDIGRQPGRGERKVPLMVKDCEAQEKWFGEAFKAVQQVGCRTIAKVWIKKIHPKKASRASRLYWTCTDSNQQSTHPYNGNLPKELTADPGRTRPPYWPVELVSAFL